MKFKKLLCSAFLAIIGFSGVQAQQLSVPITHVMVCCRENNAGTTFLVNGQWNPAHNYGDINQVRDILQKIKDAGINVISVDFTNPPQWDDEGTNGEKWYRSEFMPMLDNIDKVCQEKGMQFIMFLGNPNAWTMKYWNEKAGEVLKKYANKPEYRRYGFGDDRPMLIMFYPGQDFKEMWDKTPENEKNNLEKFHIGTCQVNDPILFTETDGWGYRNVSQSVDGKVRFVAPNGGVAPAQWYRVDAKEWKKRVEWAGQASEYSVIGSYDDVCDAIFWGIADVSKSTRKEHINSTTVDDPYVYYNIVKNYLQNRK